MESRLPLIDSCEKAISEERCLGCTAIENPYFMGNKDCEYSKAPTAKESINKIHEILGIQEKLNLEDKNER